MPITRFLEFSGGMNTQVNQFIMKDNECNLIKNFSLETIGAMEKVLGYVIRGAKIGASHNVLGMTEYSRNADSSRTHLVTVYDTIYKNVAGTWTAFTGSGTGLTVDKKMEFETFLDAIFAVNGTDANRTYNGTTWSTSTYLAGAPIASYVKRYHDALYLAGLSTMRNRVWFSDVPTGNTMTWGWAVGTNGANTGAVFTSASSTFKTVNIKIGDTLRLISGTTTTQGDYIVKSVDSETQLTLVTTPATNGSSMTYQVGSNWVPIGEDDGDVITGFGENSDRLLVFKEFSLHRWDGTSNMRVSDVGTPSSRSVQNIDSWTLFANRKGIYVYDGASVKLISRKIQKYIDAIDQTTLGSMVAWTSGNLYKLFVGNLTVDGMTYTNTVIVYDVSQNNSWIECLATPVKVAGRTVESGTEKHFIGNDVSTIYELESGTTHATAVIDGVIKTKNFDFDYPESYKKSSTIIIFGNNLEGCNATFVPDIGNPVELGSLNNGWTVFTTAIRFRRAGFTFSHGDTTSTPIIEGIIVQWNEDGKMQ